MNYKLTIEYNGSSFKGWQINKNEITVQGALVQGWQHVLCKQVLGKTEF